MTIIALSFISYVFVSDRRIKTNEVSPPEISIAILPFKNLSDNKENMYFSDGMYLFDSTPNPAGIPLAERLRPHRLDDMVGQQQLIGEGKLLRRLIE